MHVSSNVGVRPRLGGPRLDAIQPVIVVLDKASVDAAQATAVGPHRDRTLRRVVRSAPGASMRNLKRGHQALRRHASKRLKSERRLSRNLKRNTRSKKAQRRKGKNRFPRLRRDS